MSSIKNRIKAWIKKNKVIDVIIFGSSIRGKSAPSDLDLCILLQDTKENQSIDMVSSLHNELDKFELKIQINILNSSSFIDGNTLAKTLLLEGFSVKNNEQFSKNFGLENKSTIIYSLKKFSPSRRVQFHYLLNGRYGSKGVLKELNGKMIAQGTISIDTFYEDKLKEIFDQWNVEYKINRNLSE